MVMVRDDDCGRKDGNFLIEPRSPRGPQGHYLELEDDSLVRALLQAYSRQGSWDLKLKLKARAEAHRLFSIA